MVDFDEEDAAPAKASEPITRDDRPLSKRAGVSERPMARRPLGGRGVVLPRPPGLAPVVAPTASRFETLRRLGSSESGEALLVRDQDIDRTVAVERVVEGSADASASGSALMRFARRVRTMGRLEHPNIVAVHDVAIDDEGTHYAVLKYVEGETLDAVITHLAEADPAYRARFTFERRTQIFIEVLRAFDFAHARGIVHGGITPRGITIGPRFETVVTDWDVAITGDARDSGRDSTTKRLPLASKSDETYLPPEPSLDARTDTYRLSAVFHAFLTLRSTGARVPPELVHFVRRGMQKEPAQRYQSVAEMIEALERIREGRVPVQCIRTFTKRMLTELRYASDAHPLFVLLALVATFALLAAGAGAIAVRALG